MSFKTWKERSKEEINIVSRTIDCPYHPKIIIGRGGQNIKTIQYNTNTQIKILRDDNTILIKGYKEEDLEQAIEEIMNSNNAQDRRENEMYRENEVYQENTPNFSAEDFPTLGEATSSPRKKIGFWNR